MASRTQHAPRVIFLTGAPSKDDINSTELTDEYLPSIERFLHGVSTDNVPEPTPSSNWPNWRALEAVDDTHSEDLLSPQRIEDSFAAAAAGHEDTDYDFLEHSLITYTHNDAPSHNDTDTHEGDDTFLDDSTFLGESFLSEITDFNSPVKIQQPSMRHPAFVTDLRRLPSASVIERSYPQTITVNLLVGIISVSAPRLVEIRRFGYSKRIVEAVVGDETRTGFAITFWLPPRATGVETGTFEDELTALRSGQIVVLGNVALRAFKGTVYGQSQPNRRGRATGTTIVRITGGSAYAALPAALQKKYDRVEGWVMDFLHTTKAESKTPVRPAYHGLHGAGLEESQLPPDTL